VPTPSRCDPGDHRRRPDRGAAAAELVIAVPALLTMVLLIVQFAVYEHARHIAQAVAAQALTAARISDGTATAGQAAGAGLALQLGPSLTGMVLDVQRSPDRVIVTVNGQAEQVLPWVTLPITVRDEGPVETLPAANR
jgi:Flp pilus assembly protein TadG